MRKLIMRIAYWAVGFNTFKPNFDTVNMEGLEDLKQVSKKAIYYDISDMSESKLMKYCRFNENTRGICYRKKFGNKDVIVVFAKKNDISCIIHETIHVYQYATGEMFNTTETLNKEKKRISSDYGMFLPEYYMIDKEIDARYTQYQFEDMNELDSLHRI